MRVGYIVIAIALLLQMASLAHAQANLIPQSNMVLSLNPAENLCVLIFGYNANGQQVPNFGLGKILPGISDFATYNFMLQFSLEIILAVLMIMALLYAIGTAFSIPRVITYVKTEYLESILNIVIIVMLFGGMIFIAQGVSFITNLGGSVVSASGVQAATTGYALGTGASVSTVPLLYSSICNVYFNDAVLHFGGLAVLSGDSLIYSIASGFSVQAMPNGMGIETTPLNGLTPFMQVLSFMTPLISGAIIVELGIIFLLAIIYYLFPIFLFSGILLRCFPWTRAAGGTLLALFIGFYVFFPALLYPFASVDYRCLAAQQSACISQGQQQLNLPAIPTDLAGIFSYVQTLPGNINTFFGEGQFIALMDFWIFSIINASFQIFGVVLSFVISYNLLEGFADLLGAPSLQAKNMLKKVI